MPRLGVNIDHVATLRQARGGTDPDPLAAAVLVELAGADGIVVHLREDRRHIQDRDLRLLRELIRTKLDLEMAADETMAKIALTIKPDMVTLVPEQRQELTTEGGLDVAGHKDRIQQVVTLLHDGGIPVSLFIEPDLAQVKAAHRVSADFVELHTGRYANATTLERSRCGSGGYYTGRETLLQARHGRQRRARLGLSQRDTVDCTFRKSSNTTSVTASLPERFWWASTRP